MATDKIQLGKEWVGETVSSGTLRSQDLIPAFWGVLDSIPNAHDRTRAKGWVDPYEIPVSAFSDDGHEFWGSDDAVAMLDTLFIALDTIAPEGCTFGAHEGDGALFGFWPVETDEE